jgi:hypothetical protein
MYLSVVPKTGDFRGLHWFTGVQITPKSNAQFNLSPENPYLDWGRFTPGGRSGAGGSTGQRTSLLSLVNAEEQKELSVVVLAGTSTLSATVHPRRKGLRGRGPLVEYHYNNTWQQASLRVVRTPFAQTFRQLPPFPGIWDYPT